MIVPDFKRLLLLARLSALVYETDEAKLEAGVVALGLTFVGFAANSECQAMVVGEPAGQVVVIRGTQVTGNLSLAELWDDADPGHVDLGDGALVRAGAWSALDELWDDQLGGMVDPLRPITVTGHSLGGQRAVLFPWLLPADADSEASVCRLPASATTASGPGKDERSRRSRRSAARRGNQSERTRRWGTAMFFFRSKSRPPPAPSRVRSPAMTFA